MIVGEVCNRDVVVVERSESVVEAARLMREHHVGTVVVAEQSGGQAVPVGILTDRDIVMELVAPQIDFDSVTVGDAMGPELLTLAEDENFNDAVSRMRDKGVRRAPVVNAQGGLAGIIAVDDVIELIAEQLENVVKLLGREQRREESLRS